MTEPKDRARAYGLIGAAFGMGFIFGPALSGVLVAGIPLEELLFGGAFGWYWTGLYEHFTWRTSVASPGRRGRHLPISEGARRDGHGPFTR